MCGLIQKKSAPEEVQIHTCLSTDLNYNFSCKTLQASDAVRSVYDLFVFLNAFLIKRGRIIALLRLQYRLLYSTLSSRGGLYVRAGAYPYRYTTRSSFRSFKVVRDW